MADTDEVEIPEVDYVSGSGIPIRGNDIDTDQIIPARFMKVVTFDGLGEFAFFDLRFTEDDELKDHPMNEERFQDSSVMVVNNNFGCGSSREHAPQALMRWGIDAIVGESFAEIFAGNCLALGIPTVTADAETIEELQDWVDEHPDGELEIDIEAETVTYGGETIDVTVDDAQRKALVEGVWDTTALMKSNAGEVAKLAGDLPYVEDAAIPESE
ncbi:3-isopropylmalate dehydratase small subunit [Natronobacterium gregoryi]|uniref:3-isopropylmalate dehydratase n=2 Tax=Natronobacterium gregoryi TaxID=44930 RepID=L0ADX5_NATGS|nr:3-isopropylmalate dehydratase small subunit [Natronobacterium gregoryi]AFZ71352.1 3-isopropylmalate dehydratase, small subunit [Natronobacterium gregoryi SP2]ELY67007.1 3-isopropylmalate dehydratase small subunit [Natronobacterium gregoryi SP2]PLK21268.1 3-isopropylmalate dehydratase small subunit [Natronobacterium gregoryi SP2]SFI85616.1 3-isopropylmalate dehydratase, small subunit [Natronobacterium gregoryi]